MLDIHREVFLAHSVLIYGEVVRSDVWQKIPVGVFDLKFDRHGAAQWSELDLGFLSALFSLVEWAGGSIGNGNRCFLPGLLVCTRRFLRVENPGAIDQDREEDRKRGNAESLQNVHGSILLSPGEFRFARRLSVITAATRSPSEFASEYLHFR